MLPPRPGPDRDLSQVLQPDAATRFVGYRSRGLTPNKLTEDCRSFRRAVTVGRVSYATYRATGAAQAGHPAPRQLHVDAWTSRLRRDRPRCSKPEDRCCSRPRKVPICGAPGSLLQRDILGRSRAAPGSDGRAQAREPAPRPRDRVAAVRKRRDRADHPIPAGGDGLRSRRAVQHPPDHGVWASTSPRGQRCGGSV